MRALSKDPDGPHSAGAGQRLVESLPQGLRDRRRALRLTLDQLHESTGLAAGFIGQIERGVKRPSLDTLERLAAGLGLTLEELLRSVQPARTQAPASGRLPLLAGHAARERALLYHVLRLLSRDLRRLPRSRAPR